MLKQILTSEIFKSFYQYIGIKGFLKYNSTETFKLSNLVLYTVSQPKGICIYLEPITKYFLQQVSPKLITTLRLPRGSLNFSQVLRKGKNFEIIVTRQSVSQIISFVEGVFLKNLCSISQGIWKLIPFLFILLNAEEIQVNLH